MRYSVDRGMSSHDAYTPRRRRYTRPCSASHRSASERTWVADDSEALRGEAGDQSRDAGGAVLQQKHRERVAEFDAAQRGRVVHGVTMTDTPDRAEFARRWAGRCVAGSAHCASLQVTSPTTP